MKKYLYIFLLIEFCFCQYWKYELVKKDHIWYKENSSTPFSGINSRIWPNGKIKDKYIFRNGEIQSRQSNYENGKKAYYSLINNNILKETEWYETGRKKNIQQFIVSNDDLFSEIKTGQWIEWNEYGIKIKEENYNNGYKEGKWILWYDNKKKWKQGEFKNDKENGHFIKWRKNGNIIEEGSFIDGYKEGKWTYYFDKIGNKDTEQFYTNGKKNGSYISWYENGELHIKGNYKNGRKDGDWIHHKGDYDDEKIYLAKYYEGDSILNLGMVVNESNFNEWSFIIDKVKNFRQRKHYDLCIIVLEEFAKMNEEYSSNAQYIIGDIYLNDYRDFDKAINSYIKVVKKFPGSFEAPDAQFMIAYIYENIFKDILKAKIEYETFLKTYPKHKLIPSVEFCLKNI